MLGRLPFGIHFFVSSIGASESGRTPAAQTPKQESGWQTINESAECHEQIWLIQWLRLWLNEQGWIQLREVRPEKTSNDNSDSD